MSLTFSIDKAAEIVGSQRKLAAELGIQQAHLSEMKFGRRPCPLGMRAKIAHIAGHDTTRAVFEGLAAKLDAADEYEGKALDMLQAMIDAFPAEGEAKANEKSPVNPEINRASSSWRNRKVSHLLQARMTRRPCPIDGTLHHRVRHLVKHRKSTHGVLTSRVQPHHLSLVL